MELCSCTANDGMQAAGASTGPVQATHRVWAACGETDLVACVCSLSGQWQDGLAVRERLGTKALNVHVFNALLIACQMGGQHAAAARMCQELQDDQLVPNEVRLYEASPQLPAGLAGSNGCRHVDSCPVSLSEPLVSGCR